MTENTLLPHITAGREVYQGQMLNIAIWIPENAQP